MNIWLEIKNQKAKSDLEILPEKVLEMYIEVIWTFLTLPSPSTRSLKKKTTP